MSERTIRIPKKLVPIGAALAIGTAALLDRSPTPVNYFMQGLTSLVSQIKDHSSQDQIDITKHPFYTEWQQQFATYRLHDQKNSAPENEVAFFGSSTINYWEPFVSTKKSPFNGRPYIIRGMRGALAERDILPHLTDLVGNHNNATDVFLYFGNEAAIKNPSTGEVLTAGNLTAEESALAIQKVAREIKKDCPKATIHIIGQIPTPNRRNIFFTQQDINNILKADSQQEGYDFIDVFQEFAADATNPQSIDTTLFADGQHLDTQGNEKLMKDVEKRLKKPTS